VLGSAESRRGQLAPGEWVEAPYVSVVGLETGTLVDRIPVPGSEGIAASPDGRTVALAAPYGDLSRPASDPTGVRLVDVTAGKVTGLLPTEHLVYPVHITATGPLLAGEVVVDWTAASGSGCCRSAGSR
jgi:hypothetical protein